MVCVCGTRFFKGVRVVVYQAAHMVFLKLIVLDTSVSFQVLSYE